MLPSACHPWAQARHTMLRTCWCSTTKPEQSIPRRSVLLFLRSTSINDRKVRSSTHRRSTPLMRSSAGASSMCSTTLLCWQAGQDGVLKGGCTCRFLIMAVAGILRIIDQISFNNIFLILARCWHAYLPMQNRLNITPSKSSDENAPVMLLRRSCASRSSSANKSSA